MMSLEISPSSKFGHTYIKVARVLLSTATSVTKFRDTRDIRQSLSAFVPELVRVVIETRNMETNLCYTCANDRTDFLKGN